MANELKTGSAAWWMASAEEWESVARLKESNASLYAVRMLVFRPEGNKGDEAAIGELAIRYAECIRARNGALKKAKDCRTEARKAKF